MKAYPRNSTVDGFERTTRYMIDSTERPCACASCPFAAWRCISPVVTIDDKYSRNPPQIVPSVDRVALCHCTHLNTETMRSEWAPTTTGEWVPRGSSEVVYECSPRELEIEALEAAVRASEGNQ